MYTSSLWQIYCDSFPESERRNIAQQEKVQQHPLYRLEYITHEGSPVGFMAWWDLEQCVFIEHLAVDSTYRSYGLGGKFLNAFIAGASKPVVLEVEPTDQFMAKPPVPSEEAHTSAELKQRRIGFYERLGLKLNPYLYYQPSFKDDGQHVQLLLMSYPNALNESDFEQVAESLYTHVYNRPGNPHSTIKALEIEMEGIR